MTRFNGTVIGLVVVSLAVFVSNSSATPIVTTYTSATVLQTTLPPGSNLQDFTVGEAEFGDLFGGTSLDFNLTYVGNGSIVQVPEDGVPGCSGVASECLWNTTGSVSFLLDSGTANTFVISYMELAAGQAAPFVRMTLADNSVFDVGSLIGGPFESPGELFFAFTSTEPFKAVSLTMPANDPLSTQFVAFGQIEPVPEPATLVLVATGVLARCLQSRRGGRRNAASRVG